MKLLITQDIHQYIPKWEQLVKKVKFHSPNAVLIAGDLYPKDTGILRHKEFTPKLKKYIEQIKELNCEVFLTLGNDDNELMIPDFESLHNEGLFQHLHNRHVKWNDLYFVGMPWVTDHPFGYKAWCRKEFNDNLGRDERTYGSPILVTPDNKWKGLTNLEYNQYLTDNISIYDQLNILASDIELDKSIWLIHNPPIDSGLAYIRNPNDSSKILDVGSEAVKKFIEEKQPFMTIHGHIHESVEYSHKWHTNIGKTLCIQGGQLNFRLYYVICDIQDGKVVNKEHSIYDWQ